MPTGAAGGADMTRGDGSSKDTEDTFDLEHRVEEVLLQAPRRYTRLDIHQRAGISPERARRLWRSLGFPNVGDEELIFTDADVAAIGLLEQLRATGLVPESVQHAVVRSMAQAMSGLAVWQVELLHQILSHSNPPPEEWPDRLAAMLPRLEYVQNHVWRRHLVAAAGRMLSSPPDGTDLRTLVVGSSDLVGFTRLSRRITPTQLIDLVEEFHGIAADVTTGHRGRIVKTVGDAVLFVTDSPEDAAQLALDLLERTAASELELPELRTGLAIGPTLTRFGDIYGEVVDVATRLCTHARPGRILVDHALATVLDGDRRFRLRLRRPIAEPGYPKLQPWGLRRAPD